MATNKPRSKADPLQLRCYSVTLPFIRNWLFQKGHEDAAKSLSEVEYVDLELAWEEFYERHRAGEISGEEARRWLESVLEGQPQERPSILPSFSLTKGRGE